MYHIAKGHHDCAESTIIPVTDADKTYTVTCKIPNNCLYNFNNKKYNLQSNKIEGHSFGLDHHKDSIRTAYRPKFASDGLTPKNQFAILAYYYNKGKSYPFYLFTVNPNQQFSYTVTIDRANNKITWTWIVGIKTGTKSFPYDFTNVPTWGYELFFYFGGDKTAPNDMTIDINK